MDNGLDIDKIKPRLTETISTEEALRDVEPFDVPQEVLDGKAELVGTSAIIDKENNEISLSMELKSYKEKKSTKEIYEDFYKKPYNEITKEDIDECELINWGPDVGGEVIEQEEFIRTLVPDPITFK